MIKPEKKLINWRNSILYAIKRQIREILGIRPDYLDKYYLDYRKEFLKNYKKVSEKKLFEAIDNSRLIFIGDYHTLKEAQNFQLKVIKYLKSKKLDLILYMEPFAQTDQKIIDYYLSGKISEEEFLYKVKFKKKWGFFWENYKDILSYARENNIKIYGINLKEEASLEERDLFAANFILDKIRKDSEKRHVVIIGDLHLAFEHLPVRIIEKLEKDFPYLIIYQNSETIYKKEMEKGKEESLKVVKLSDSSFCVFNTPPWVKYQSYLIYLMRSKIINPEEKNLDDLASILLEKLGSFFGKKWECNIEVKTIDEYDFLFNLLNVEKSHLFFMLLQENYSFFLPYENLIWLPYPDLLRFVEELAHFIFYEEGKWERGHIFEEDYFYERIIYYAFGYFCSKLLFEERKTQSLKELKEILMKKSDERAEKKLERLKKSVPYILKLTKNLNGEKKIKKHEKFLDEKLCFTITRRTGYILGEKWFKLFKKGKLSCNDIIKKLPVFKKC